MIKYLAVFIVLMVPITAVAQQQPFVSIEYAPFSRHLSNNDAPRGGYNETNNMIMLKIGHENVLNNQWDWNYSAGYAFFDNSYDLTSHGLGGGVEFLRTVRSSTKLYVGIDAGLVSGYEDNVSDDAVLFGELIPFAAFNGGVEYDLGKSLPSIRAGAKYVPASLVGSDDVIALSIGLKHELP
jgi:hypothetical protein